MEEFLEEAQEIEREFQAGIQNVVDNYDTHIQAEKDRSPLMSDLIDQLKLTKMILLNHSGLIWHISFRFHRLVWRGMKRRTFIKNNW